MVWARAWLCVAGLRLVLCVLGRMAVDELMGSARGCVVRCEVAMWLECGCSGCNGEGVRVHTVGLRASRRSGPWPHLGNSSAGGICGRGTISYMVHLGSYWLYTDCCRHGQNDVARELFVHRVHGNARIAGE
jgi:hypothetical protein